MAQISKKIIIVGKTGNGKSSLGNNILGKKCFANESGFSASTLRCQLEKYGQFEIVDTPGLFDTNTNQNVAQQAKRIVEALNLCPAPHAFLFAIKYDRYTADEVSALDVMRITFGEQFFDHAIVIVTHVNNDVTDTSFENGCRESQQVSELLKLCGHRVVRIDNENPKEEHVSTLLRYINQVSKDGNSWYDNDYLGCHKRVLMRNADLDRHDSMPVHEQVEIIAKEIRKEVDREVEMNKKEREEREKKEKEERKRQRKEKKAREKEDMLLKIGGLVVSSVAAAAGLKCKFQ